MIELIMTLAIMGSLLALAAPNFSDAMLNSRQSVNTNTLMGALRLARSEAIKRSAPTSVCARSTNNTCGSDWSNGLLVFIDNVSNPGAIDTGEEIIRVVGPFSEGMTINNLARLRNSVAAPIQRPFVRYGPSGSSNWRGAGYFTLCDQRKDLSLKAVNISLSGSPTLGRKEDGNVINVFGQPASCDNPNET